MRLALFERLRIPFGRTATSRGMLSDGGSQAFPIFNERTSGAPDAPVSLDERLCCPGGVAAPSSATIRRLNSTAGAEDDCFAPGDQVLSRVGAESSSRIRASLAAAPRSPRSYRRRSAARDGPGPERSRRHRGTASGDRSNRARRATHGRDVAPRFARVGLPAAGSQ